MDSPALRPLSVLLGIVAQLLIKSCWGIFQPTASPDAGTPHIQGRKPDRRNLGTPTRRFQVLFSWNLWILFQVFKCRVKISFHQLRERLDSSNSLFLDILSSLLTLRRYIVNFSLFCSVLSSYAVRKASDLDSSLTWNLGGLPTACSPEFANRPISCTPQLVDQPACFYSSFWC
jgi:hypothetical protein